MKTVYIDSQNEINYKIEEFLKPQLIYIPLKNNKLLIKNGDYVYKGDIVALENETNFSIYSSVSGNVTNIVSKFDLEGNQSDYIVIENDFKEKYKNKLGYSKAFSKYSKDDFVKLLFNMGIKGLSGSNNKTYKKYINEKIKCLIVNGVECEPSLCCDKSIMYNYSEELLECVDSILEIMQIPKAIIVVKEANQKSISNIKKSIGSYPNITLAYVSDSYPIGWDRCLIENVFGLKYKKDPSEIGIIVNSVSTIYVIYETLKFRKPLIERVITISGDGIKKSVNVKVKIGSNLNEIISQICQYKDKKDLLFIVNGLMSGISLPTDEVIVSSNLNSVVVMQKKFIKSQECINCGRCVELCPVKLYPSIIFKNIDNLKMLNKLNVKSCINCGLCSYVCPSKIELSEYLKIAKKKVDDRNEV